MTWEQCIMAGMSQTEAAKARGVSQSAACQWAKRNGRRFKDKGRGTPVDYSHLAHLTVKEAAEAAGVTKSAISNWSSVHYVLFANTRWYDKDGVCS